MKKLAALLLLIICVGIHFSAHEVNRYKFLVIEIDENPYGIEKRFNEEFMKLGFQTINHDTFEKLDTKDKSVDSKTKCKTSCKEFSLLSLGGDREVRAK